MAEESSQVNSSFTPNLYFTSSQDLKLPSTQTIEASIPPIVNLMFFKHKKCAAWQISVSWSMLKPFIILCILGPRDAYGSLDFTLTGWGITQSNSCRISMIVLRAKTETILVLIEKTSTQMFLQERALLSPWCSTRHWMLLGVFHRW